MSKIYFRYGAMNSGKSTALLQVAHNYEERGQHVIVAKPSVDTKGSGIVSRLGATRDVDLFITPTMNLFDEIKHRLDEKKIDCLLVDESQFLTRDQVNQLMLIAVELDVPVIAYGIRNDFRTNAFPGSLRLLEIAHSIEELKTICRCGRKAILNGLKINGQWVREDDRTVIIDDGSVEYESLCAADYVKYVGPIT